MKGLNHLHRRAGTVQPIQPVEGNAWGSQECVWIPEGRVGRRWSQAFFSGLQWQDQRQWARGETQEALCFPVRVMEHWSRSLQGLWGCGVVTPGDAQKLSGCGPGQRLWGALLEQGQDDPQRFLPTSASLWFWVTVYGTDQAEQTSANVVKRADATFMLTCMAMLGTCNSQ